MNKIQMLNDSFRKDFTGGRVMFTPGIIDLGDIDVVASKVREFNDFEPGNDPYGEHDFGAFDYEGTKIFWKIDYYDNKLELGSPDPADSSKTTRVLTIMTASEY